MGLKSDQRALKTQLDILKDQESDIASYNKVIDSLIEEVSDCIISDNAFKLVDAVEALKDMRGAVGGDSNISGAKSRIRNEISVISQAIRMQEEAARVMANAAKKG